MDLESDMARLREHTRWQLETYAGYFEARSRWITEEEKEKHPNAERLLNSIRERVNTHPKVWVASDIRTPITSVRDYDRIDIAIVANTACKTVDEINDLAQEVFEGFYDPEHVRPKVIIPNLLQAPAFSDLVLINSMDSFPSLHKKIPLAFVEKQSILSLSEWPDVPVPEEAIVYLLKRQPVLYKPFLWRSIHVDLYPNLEEVSHHHWTKVRTYN